jgi:DNA-binding XRE family transcriptional regulator
MPMRAITRAVNQTFATAAPGRKPSNMGTPQAKQAGPQRCPNCAGWFVQAAVSPTHTSYKTQRSRAAEPARAAEEWQAVPVVPPDLRRARRNLWKLWRNTRADLSFPRVLTTQLSMITPAQIRGARAMLGLTQKELAERAGLSATALVNIETGASDPKASTIVAVQEALEAAGAEFIPNGVRVRVGRKEKRHGR